MAAPAQVLVDRYSAYPAQKLCLFFFLIALLCLGSGDFSISTQNPQQELWRMFQGLLTPSLAGIDNVLLLIAQTLQYAVLAVALSASLGLALALVFQCTLIRAVCAFVRAIHELFWALLLIQVLGFQPLAGILAIAIPFTGIFAKVFAEIIEETPTPAAGVLPRSHPLSHFFYVRLPAVWPYFRTYIQYRLECAVRSSAILGFIGLPTLGFYLHSAILQGSYSQAAALLYILLVLIASLRWWLTIRLLPLYTLIAYAWLDSGSAFQTTLLLRFLTEDIVPAPLRQGQGWPAMYQWLEMQLSSQVLPGIVTTLVLSQLALVGTALVAMLLFPFISRHFFNPWVRQAGHGVLVVIRTLPEYLLAFIFLQLWGPSLLPAVIALSLHNGAIIAHLIGHHSQALQLRQDSAVGLNRYSFEILPRVFGQLLAFLFYRWEVIMRETAILGLLGIYTLGFYVDSAIQDIRFDRACFLLLCTALLNIIIDQIASWLRLRLQVPSGFTQYASLRQPAT